MEVVNMQELQDEVRLAAAPLQLVRQEMGRIVSGQEKLVERLLLALISDGHALLEGVPGLAKTLAVKTLAQTLKGSFSPNTMLCFPHGYGVWSTRSGECIISERNKRLRKNNGISNRTATVKGMNAYCLKAV